MEMEKRIQFPLRKQIDYYRMVKIFENQGPIFGQFLNEENERVITVNRDAIDKEVRSKYVDMFRDKGIKEKLEYGNKFIKFTPLEVLKAIGKINPNKAISWDYIPGKFQK